MAIDPSIKYPGKITPADGNYDYGSAKSTTTPTSQDGTPFSKEFVNDIFFGFPQALLKVTGIVPSGNPETQIASQYLSALSEIITTLNFGEDTVNTNVYVVTTKSRATKYEEGLYFLKITNTNTGAATVNYNGLGAQNIKRNDGSPLLANNLKTGVLIPIIYNGTEFRLLDPVQLKLKKGADVASASALALGSDGNYFDITGTTPITSINTIGVGTVVNLHFDASLTLTHHATNLVLPNGKNIVTQAGDEYTFIEYATGDWRLISGNTLGAVVQTANTQTGAVATGSTQIPSDDTIPQNTEGDQYMSLAITPKSANNILKIDVVINLAIATVQEARLTAVLFQDSTANALACSATLSNQINAILQIKFSHRMVAGTISPTTFKVRAGSSFAAIVTFNGEGGSRKYGGVLASGITVTEYKPT